MSKFLKGHSVSRSIRDKISKTRIENKVCRGKNNPMYGKNHSDKSKIKISESRKSKFGGKYVKCEICNKIFWKKKSLIHKRFCSRKCSALGKKTGKYKICKICNKKFYVRKKRLVDKVYCSNECKLIGMKTDKFKKCEYALIIF